MTSETRTKILSSIDQYSSWKNKQDENSSKYIKFPVTNEKLSVSSLSDVSSNIDESYLNNFKQELEAKIIRKYLPADGLSHRNTITVYRDTDKRENIWTKPRLSRFYETGGRDTTSELKKTSIVYPNKIIKLMDDIPGYFNSPEGKPFISKPVTKNKLEESVENKCETPIHEIQGSENPINVYNLLRS